MTAIKVTQQRNQELTQEEHQYNMKQERHHHHPQHQKNGENHEIEEDHHQMHGKKQQKPDMEKHGKIGEIRTQTTHRKEQSTTDHNAGNGEITENAAEKIAHSKQIIHQKPKEYKRVKRQEETTEITPEVEQIWENQAIRENETIQELPEVMTEERQTAKDNKPENNQGNEERYHVMNGNKQEDAAGELNADLRMMNKQNEKYLTNHELRKLHQAKEQEKEEAVAL